MSCFADLQQRRADEWNVVLQFLDARDWMRVGGASGAVYHAKRFLTDEERAWFQAKDIPVKLLETIVVDVWGTQRWHQNGVLHRDGDRPAVIKVGGSKYWYQNGRLHRDGNRPAVIDNRTGSLFWYHDGFQYKCRTIGLGRH